MAHTLLDRWRTLDTSPNRIAVWTAIRGTIAVGAPLFLLPLLGIGPASHFVVMGALATGIVDTGGPYGRRLRAMLTNAIVSPLTMLLGMACAEIWWLAALMLAGVAAFGGMMRAFGPSAAPLGVLPAVAFLIGTKTPRLMLLAAPSEAAGAYAAGGLWTILVAVVIWRARPYRRIESEIASVWEELAALMAMLHAAMTGEASRARLERALAERQRTLRDATERARILIDEAQAEIAGQSAPIEAMMVLLRGASRISTVAGAVADRILQRVGRAALEPLVPPVAALAQASRSVAAVLSHGRGRISVDELREALRRLQEEAGKPRGLPPFGVALRHIENAEDAVETLFGTRQRFRGLLPPLGPLPSMREGWAALGAHLNPRSLILRHALRVAVCTGVAMAVMMRLDIPHGIWLPLTALVVAQPEFGGTWRRSFERILGTIGGAVLSAVLLWLLSDTVGLDIAIVVLSFCSFLLLRRRYGFAMVFLTPLIILLLGLSGSDPGEDILHRVIDTVAGGGLALLAAYLLWPQWERERLTKPMTDALRANATYLAHTLAMLSEGKTMDTVVVPRRVAEIATGNAEAALQRMLSEPKGRRDRLGRWHVLVTHLRRLNRHTSALAAHLDESAARSAHAPGLSKALTDGLEAAARRLEGKADAAYASPEAEIAAVRQELTEAEADAAPEAADALIGRIVTDVGALYAASASR
ncbi:MAG: FUSC family protein [Alphaproteobacteria bacterium]